MKRLLLTIFVTLLTLVGPAVAADKDAKAAAPTPMAAQKAPTAAEKLDLNTATEQELSQLPGIGEIRSKAIVKGRPYQGKDELVERKILTQSVYDKIKDQVIAKQAAATPSTAPAAASAKPKAAQKAPTAAEKLDLNTATEQELSRLPGIGEIRSKAIVKGRPYQGKDELVERKILTQSVYDKIKEQVIAKQAAATPSTAPAAASAKPMAKSEPMPTAPAPGGGAGKVWVNTATYVYHCSNDRWYGMTKKGEYMSEADAKLKGNRAERGKSCS